MKYVGSLDHWFIDRPIIERIEAFARQGINRIHIGGWRSRPMNELHVECYRLGVKLVSTFDDQMGCLTDPLDNDQTLQAWAESLKMAESLGINHLYLFSNQVSLVNDKEQVRALSAPYTADKQWRNLIQQTEQILKLAEQTEVIILVQNINRFDAATDLLIHNVETAAQLVQHFNHKQLRLAFDCYHQQRDSGNLIWNLVAHDGLYHSLTIADVPSQGEPGTGEINFANLRTTLRELKFAGLVKLAFKPADNEADSLARLRKLFPLD